MLVGGVFLLSSCAGYVNTNLRRTSGKSLSGRVIPLVGLMSRNDAPMSVLRTLHASSCDQSDVTVELFRIDSTTGEPQTVPAATTQLNIDGTYTFKDITSRNTDVRGVSSDDHYLIRVSGCAGVDTLERKVTDYRNQDVTTYSTLIATLLSASSSARRGLLLSDRDSLSQFIEKLSSRLGSGGTSIQSAYMNLASDANLANEFQSLFNVSIDSLKDSAPLIRDLEIPATLREAEGALFRVASSHWDPNYSQKVIWKLDSTVLSQNSQFTFTPSKNKQGSYVLSLWVGQNDGNGGLDLTKPYFYRTKDIVIANNSLPTPPTFTVLGSHGTNTNTRSIQLAVQTGAQLVHCDSFSSFAITEDRSTAPMAQNLYSETCLTAGTQNINYSIAGANDGLKWIQIWAQDDLQTFSTAPSQVLVTLDTTAPALQLQSTIPSLVRGGDSVVLQYSVSDATSGLQGLTAEFSSDNGAHYLAPVALPVGASSASITIPTVDTSQAVVRLRATDNVGNLREVVSNVFSVDSTPSSTPTVVLATGTPTRSRNIAMTLTSSCTDIAGIYINESGTPNASSSGWVPCTNASSGLTYQLNSTTEGLRAVQIWAKDAIGNMTTTAVIVHVTLDTTAPAAPSVALASASITNQANANLTISSCTDRTHILVNEGSAPSDSDSSWQTCQTTVGAFVYSLSSGSQGSRNLKVWAKDLAGNVSSTAGTVTLTYDTTPPAAPSVTRTSSEATNSTSITLTAQSCSDAAYVLVSESSTAPQSGAAQWQMCQTTTSAITYTLSGSTEGSRTLYVYAKDAAENVSLTGTSLSLTYDTTPPIAPSVALTSGSPTNASLVTFSASDCTDRPYIFFNEGSQPTASASGWQPCVTTPSALNYTLSNGDGTKSIKAWSKDSVGNVSTASTAISVNLDQTPPALPVVTLASAAITNQTAVSITIASCADRSAILVNESTQPLANDSSWQTCSTAAGAITYTLPGALEASRTLNVWAKDSIGNVTLTANQTLSVTYDITQPTAPSIALATVSPTNLSSAAFTASSCADSSKILINESTTAPLENDSAWQNCSTTPSALTYNLGTTNGARSLKAWAKDVAGNVSSTPTALSLTVDTGVPTISSFTVNGGASSTALPSVTIAISGSDSLSNISHMQISENSSPSAGSWITYATTGTYSLSQTNGLKTVNAWVRDAAGNVSLKSTITITLDFGTPPTVSVTSPVAGSTYNSPQTVPIGWSCSSTNALSSSPVRIRYTTDDGVTFSNVTSGWVANNASSTTGTYDWPIPASTGMFRILIECRSEAGVVSSALSGPINSGGWTIYAGDPANMSEDVSITVGLVSRAGSSFQSMAGDINGNIFYERGRAIFKIDSTSGLITRFVGDPNYSGSLCNIQEGSDPVNSTYNKLNGSPFILGPNPTRTGILFSACGKTWSLNPTTRALTQINTSSYANTSGFLSRTGKYYYPSYPGKLFRVDFNQINATPELIFGNATTCEALSSFAAVGTIAAQTKMIGDASTGACMGEMYVATNPDDSKIWFGTWYQHNTVRLDWSATSSAYVIGSRDVGWRFEWNGANCVPSFKTSRVFCSGRWAQSSFTSYDTSTNTWLGTSRAISPFLRYAATPAGMVSIDSNNLIYEHRENDDGTITRIQIGGSDIEVYGNGTDRTKVAFSTVNGIVYSTAAKRLLIGTPGSMRYFNLNTGNISSVAFGYGYFDPAKSMQFSNDGNTLSNLTECVAIKQTFNGTTLASTTTLFQPGPVPCFGSVATIAHPLTGDTAATGAFIGFGTWFSIPSRPVNHSNGRHYFFVKNRSTNADAYIYSTNGTTIKLVAGKTGAIGYASGDHGQTALGATLSEVNYMAEIPAGKPNAGDLLIADNNRLRLITITTESSAPKIYDLVTLTMATNYTSGTTDTMTDAHYDFSSELSSGGIPVLGSGIFYYVRSNYEVHRFAPTALTSGAVSAATDTTYVFSGTTLGTNSYAAKVRIALTPDGLLVTQPNRARVLRVDP